MISKGILRDAKIFQLSNLEIAVVEGVQPNLLAEIRDLQEALYAHDMARAERSPGRSTGDVFLPEGANDAIVMSALFAYRALLQSCLGMDDMHLLEAQGVLRELRGE